MNYSNEPLLTDTEYLALVSDYKEHICSIQNYEANILPFEDAHLIEESDIGYDDEKERTINDLFKQKFNELYKNRIYFYGCPFDNYLSTYQKRLEDYLEIFYDGEEIDFIQNELNKGILSIPYAFLNNIITEQIQASLRKRLEYLKEKASALGYEITVDEFNPNGNESFEIVKIENHEVEKVDSKETSTTESTSSSLLFNGKKLNLAERYKIANEILNIDSSIRKLNISDTDKYQLVAYILGCNSTNARHVMNGTYKGKMREKELLNYLETLNK